MFLEAEALGYLGFDNIFTSVVWLDRENWPALLSGNYPRDNTQRQSELYTFAFNADGT